MKGTLNIRFFNQKVQKCTVNVLNDAIVQLMGGEQPLPKLKGISLDAYTKARACVTAFLTGAIGAQRVDNVAFSASSPELEKLADLGAAPDQPSELAQLLAAEALRSLLWQNGVAYPDGSIECSAKNEGDVTAFLKERFEKAFIDNKDKFAPKAVELSALPPVLARAEELAHQGEYADCLDVLAQLDDAQLPPQARGRRDVLLLKATVKTRMNEADKPDNKKLYERLAQKFKNEQDALLGLHFVWLTYLQDLRDDQSREEVKKLRKKISKDFARSRLSISQSVQLRYLEGRSDYYDGEYLGALGKLDSALADCPADDLETRADILNTAASSFTDNLFFEEADALHDEALKIRHDLKLKRQWETVSAKGVTAFKKRDFARAAELFGQAYEAAGEYRDNRICNYLAKAEIFLKDYDSALRHLDEADTLAADRVVLKAFTASVRLALLDALQEYDAVVATFQNTFLKPEYRKDLFPAGWGYRFVARAKFQLGKTEDAVKYLARSVCCFTEDRYNLEAFQSWLELRVWKLDAEAQKMFAELLNGVPVIVNCSQHIEKHSQLNKEYFAGQLASITGKKRLLELGELAHLCVMGDNKAAHQALGLACLL